MEVKRPVSRIATLRERAGLTQLELSQRIHVTETTISNWEKGRSGLEWIERLIRLCETLQCLPQDLIEYASPFEQMSLQEAREIMGTDQPVSSVDAKSQFQENSDVTEYQETRLEV
jgi:transcriptional regulator with XRE-family HTH domain